MSEHGAMKTALAFSLALAAGISLASCNTPQGQNAAGGAVLGGATGALIGAAATGGSPGAALAGGAIGAATGAAIGAAATPPGPYPPPYYGRCAQWAYDYSGRPICTAYY
jgi:predicted small secreted protein